MPPYNLLTKVSGPPISLTNVATECGAKKLISKGEAALCEDE
jgi:hypothetical protein